FRIDSQGYRSRSRRERDLRGREPRERDRERERDRDRDRDRDEHKVPYFADAGRERDRVRNLRQRSPRSSRRSRSRSRSRSSERRRWNRRQSRNRSRNRSRSGSRSRYRSSRSPKRRAASPPKIINYYVQGMYGTGPYGMAGPPRYGYQRMPHPPPFASSFAHSYRQRLPYGRTPRFSYRHTWQPPH
ncbi:hypothetical protein KR018_010256, partial [Drosophila ironensis]